METRIKAKVHALVMTVCNDCYGNGVHQWINCQVLDRMKQRYSVHIHTTSQQWLGQMFMFSVKNKRTEMS